MKTLKYKIINSVVGALKIIVDEEHLIAILWDVEKVGRVPLNKMEEDFHHPILLKAEAELYGYFLEKESSFNIPLNLKGTLFQKKVWQALLEIPYGKTCSYKDIAQKIGNPKAVRAVGTAIGKNPISIIIPCHRVIASNGGLGGFAGGIDRKKILLDLEKMR